MGFRFLPDFRIGVQSFERELVPCVRQWQRAENGRACSTVAVKAQMVANSIFFILMSVSVYIDGVKISNGVQNFGVKAIGIEDVLVLDGQGDDTPADLVL